MWVRKIKNIIICDKKVRYEEYECVKIRKGLSMSEGVRVSVSVLTKTIIVLVLLWIEADDFPFFRQKIICLFVCELEIHLLWSVYLKLQVKEKLNRLRFKMYNKISEKCAPTRIGV